MENEGRISKLSVAREHLECELRLYYSGGVFAALHLAGAAEKIFGEYLRRAGRRSSLSWWRLEGVELVNAIAGGESWSVESMKSRLNYAKNRTKHMNATQDAEILFDPIAECGDHLARAVSDYYALMDLHRLPETALVKRFNLHGPRA